MAGISFPIVRTFPRGFSHSSFRTADSFRSIEMDCSQLTRLPCPATGVSNESPGRSVLLKGCQAHGWTYALWAHMCIETVKQIKGFARSYPPFIYMYAPESARPPAPPPPATSDTAPSSGESAALLSIHHRWQHSPANAPRRSYTRTHRTAGRRSRIRIDGSGKTNHPCSGGSERRAVSIARLKVVCKSNARDAGHPL